MKKSVTKGVREMHRALQAELQVDQVREEAERLEKQRIEFEHGARMARTNLYGVQQGAQRGWVEARRK